MSESGLIASPILEMVVSSLTLFAMEHGMHVQQQHHDVLPPKAADSGEAATLRML